MSDPHILPDEELTEQEAEEILIAAGDPHLPDAVFESVQRIIARRTAAMGEHIKAQAEQVDTLLREWSQSEQDVDAAGARAEKAEDDAQGWAMKYADETARADAAVQALADQTKAIRDLAARYARAHFQPPVPGPMVATDLRALLPEDGA